MAKLQKKSIQDSPASKTYSGSYFEPPPPPSYAEAADPKTAPRPTAGPTIHKFARRGIRRTVSVSCNNVDRFTFKPSRTHGASIWIYPGSSRRKTLPFGCLTFATNISAFSLHFAGPEEGSPPTATNVRARVGHPHPSVFSFQPPASISQGRSYNWTHRKGRFRHTKFGLSEDLPIVYDLTTGVYNERIASIRLAKKSVQGATMTWFLEPESEVEQAFLVLSAIGVMARLARGLEADVDIMAGFGGFFWMPVLAS
ncbi:hypothetical protein KC332_g9010 [Hortaea werneckii]|nr:hypothetical protein KC358_g8851 [Hortaea werneckii]KAI6923739.1 hypothetical protein KC341_g14518 [Hortaea werneckii]KAI6924651.1 hypothetical protein KC348_g9227 [Hortaea werneckii]KAI6967414.1 hypothetical protein KC321_g9033 [Hortaea werneckii]KAI6988348.1 hypothetical protein KC329_g5549 [Hortaea werneckii]